MMNRLRRHRTTPPFTASIWAISGGDVMSICLLEGHRVARKAGIHAYEGETFTICARCGVTLDRDGHPKTKDQIEANRALDAAFERATHP